VWDCITDFALKVTGFGLKVTGFGLNIAPDAAPPRLQRTRIERSARSSATRGTGGRLAAARRPLASHSATRATIAGRDQGRG